MSIKVYLSHKKATVAVKNGGFSPAIIVPGDDNCLICKVCCVLRACLLMKLQAQFQACPQIVGPNKKTAGISPCGLSIQLRYNFNATLESD
jgi:hypothetical protein